MPRRLKIIPIKEFWFRIMVDARFPASRDLPADGFFAMDASAEEVR
jgi:hypothetical protein